VDAPVVWIALVFVTFWAWKRMLKQGGDKVHII